MLGEVGIELNASEALVEASLRKRGRKWLRRPYWSRGQRMLATPLRRCPVPGVERPTHPTSLAYVERGNPVAVWAVPSNPIARAGQRRSGHKKAQEAKAGTPKGKGKS
jgi:hypothetical protein